MLQLAQSVYEYVNFVEFLNDFLGCQCQFKTMFEDIQKQKNAPLGIKKDTLIDITEK